MRLTSTVKQEHFSFQRPSILESFCFRSASSGPQAQKCPTQVSQRLELTRAPNCSYEGKKESHLFSASCRGSASVLDISL